MAPKMPVVLNVDYTEAPKEKSLVEGCRWPISSFPALHENRFEILGCLLDEQSLSFEVFETPFNLLSNLWILQRRRFGVKGAV